MKKVPELIIAVTHPVHIKVAKIKNKCKNTVILIAKCI